MSKIVLVMEVIAELDRATEKFGPFASPHEGIAIIEEEFLELRDAVFHGTPGEARSEAVQVAAMAIRFLIDCPPEDKS